MNRRSFLSKGAIATAALSVAPSQIFANESTVSLTQLGNGLKNLKQFSSALQVDSMPSSFKDAVHKLKNALQKQGTYTEITTVHKLNNNCFAIPIQKNGLLSKEHELAFIIEEKLSYSHYILDDKLTTEYNHFLENYVQQLRANTHLTNIDELATPYKVKGYSKGKKASFIYTSKSGTTISLINHKKKTKTIIS